VFRPFSCVLRVQKARLPLLATFLGALPIGMLTVGLLLVVRQATGSPAEAGAAAGALSLGNAAGLLLQGRLIDRYGPAPVLLTAAALCPVFLVTLTATMATPYLTPVLAVASGAALPATVTGMRVLGPHLFAGPATRDAAYALLATLFHIAMVLGPLLVSALFTGIGPAVVLPVAAALATAGGLLFAASPAARATRPGARPPVHRRMPGPGVVTLLLGSAGAGVGTGLLTIALSGNGPALAGLLFAALSAGELLGGLAYGGRAWRMPTRSRLVLGLGGLSGSLALLAPATTGAAWLMLPVVALVGALAAPVAIANSALLDDIVHSGSLGRVYTVMVAAGLTGIAVGTAVAGRITGDGRATVLSAAGVLAAVTAWTHARRGTLLG
jgi:MFS family permease